MRILVTGASGFIGFNFANFLHGSGHDVMCIDYITPSSDFQKRTRRDLLSKSDIRYVDSDLSQSELGSPFHKTDVILNLAAQTGLHSGENYTRKYFDSNVLLTRNLVNFANKYDIPLVHASTSSVYGASAVGSENSMLKPISVYGTSKLQGESLILSECKQFTILRFFSVYGPGQRSDMAIAKFIEAGVHSTPVKLFSQGLHTRTPTYVGDIQNILPNILESKHENEIYNIGGIESIQTIQIIKLINKLLNTNIKLIPAGERVGDQLETKAVIDKAIAKFKYNPTTSIIKGISHQISYYMSHNI